MNENLNEQNELTGKEAYEARKAEKIAEKEKSTNPLNAGYGKTIGLVLILIALIIISINVINKNTAVEEINEDPLNVGEVNTDIENDLSGDFIDIQQRGQAIEVPIQGRDHIPNGTEYDNYSTNPPTSGTHWEVAPTWGHYKNGIPDAHAVHALEHGGIWITYNPEMISDDEIEILQDIRTDNRNATILSPREKNDSKIALTSWGMIMKLDNADKDAIQTFIDENKNNSPEPLAR